MSIDQLVRDRQGEEERFAKSLLQLIQTFNYLEENLGLSIAFLKCPADPKSVYSSLFSTNVDAKLKQWKRLIETEIDAAEKKRELGRWYERVTEARCIRNRYVHGFWEYVIIRPDKPIGLRGFSWMKSKMGDDWSERMSLAEFETTVAEFEDVFQDFLALRRKYGV